jgi:TatD DNase family protein
MTFTKDPVQLMAAKKLPLQRLLLETDCPFLAPVPKRGQRNEPANVLFTAQFLANLRGEDLETLKKQTSANTLELFGIK